MAFSGAFLALGPALLEAGGYQRSVHRSVNVHRNVNVNRNVNVHRDVDINVNRGWARPGFGAGVAVGAVQAPPPGSRSARPLPHRRAAMFLSTTAVSIMPTTAGITISPPPPDTLW